MNSRRVAFLLGAVCLFYFGFVLVVRPQNAATLQFAQTLEKSQAFVAPTILAAGVHLSQNVTGKLPHEAASNSELVSQQAADPILSAPTIYDADGHGNDAVATGDFNGDGKLDLVVANFCEGEPDNGPCAVDGTVSVLLGNGDGTFQPAVTYISGGFSSISVAVGDLNGDGKLDLAVVNSCSTNINCPSAGSVSIFLGNGDGTFQAAQTFASGGYQSYFVAMGDFNDDGNLDLAVASLCTNSDCKIGAVSIMLGKGDGTFQPPKVYTSGNSDSSEIAVADFNGDGKLDLAVTNSCNCSKGSLTIFLGNGDGTFQKPKTYMPGAPSASPVAVGDFNGDGIPDLAEAIQCADTGCADGGVNVLLGNGDGTFQPAQTYASGGGASNYVVTGDFNHDGKLDLVVENPCMFLSGVCTVGATASVLLGNGDGTFQAPLTYPSVGQVPDWMASGDFNNDGMPDLVIASTCYCNTTDNVVSVFLNIANASKQASATSISSSAGSTTYGQSVNFTATVSSTASGTPTGTVTFTDGGAALGSVSLISGAAGLTTSSLGAGTHSIIASYGGDANFSASTSTTLTQIVNQASSKISLACSNCSSVFANTPVTFTATISPQFGGVATGSVTFSSFLPPTSTVLGTSTVSGNSGSITALLPVGMDQVAASYAGDSNVAASTSSSLNFNVHSAVVTIVLTASASSIQFGQPVTLTATLSTPSGSPPDGLPVTFNFTQFGIQTAYLSGGIAKFTTSSLPLGSNSVKAQFTDPPIYASSMSANAVVTVTADPTTTTITTSGSPAVFGQSVTFSTTVSSSSGGIPTGVVSFKNTSGGFIGSATLSGGAASVSTSGLNAGTQSIFVTYAGDATHLSSTSADISQVITPAATTTSLSSSLNPSTAGQSVTLTATITSSTGPAPGGSVTFKSGTRSLGAATLVGGVATISTTALAVGSDVVTATYQGTANFTGSSATLTQVVN